jgi:excisionase family DNA binding protein
MTQMEISSKLILVTTEELVSLIQHSVRQVIAEQTPKSLGTADKPLSIDEASSFLNIPKSTLYQFTSSRKIPFQKIERRFFSSKQTLSSGSSLVKRKLERKSKKRVLVRKEAYDE